MAFKIHIVSIHINILMHIENLYSIRHLMS